MPYADCESISKPLDEQYRENMNQMKIKGNGKTPYIEKIYTHITS